MCYDEKTAEKRQCFFHGGCAVLYLYTSQPTGDSPALSHLGALVGALHTYTERELLPTARAALDDAVSRGQGYRFSPHRVHISVTKTPFASGIRLTLSFSLSVGEAPLWTRELVTHWDRSGQIQLLRAPHPRRRSSVQSHRP